MPRWLLVGLGIGAAVCGSVLIAYSLILLITTVSSSGLISASVVLGFLLVGASLFVAYRVKNP